MKPDLLLISSNASLLSSRHVHTFAKGGSMGFLAKDTQ